MLASFLNASPNKKLFGYSYPEQLKDMLPSDVLSVIMGVVIWLVSLIPMNTVLQIFIQFIVGASVYLGLAKLFNLECFEYVINTVKGLRKSKTQIKGKAK